MRHSRRGLKRRYGHSKRARKLASIASGRHVIHNANSGGKDTWRHNYIFWFGGPYSATYVRAWANAMDDALDEAVDWLSDHKPGLLADDEAINEEYKRLVAEGMDEEKAAEQAEEGTTPAGGYDQRLDSESWGLVAEDPTRERVLQIQGRR